MRYDAIVTGSGISGMVSALLLAKNSFKVLLLEKHSSPAPLLNYFRRGKYFCEPGLHYSGGFDAKGPLSAIFTYLGVMDGIEAAPLAEDGFDILQDADGNEFHIPSGIEKVRELFLSRFPGSAQAVNAYIDRIKYIVNGTYIANPSLAYGVYPQELFSGHTLEDFLQENNAAPAFINLLGNYGYLLYGSPASKAPFYLHALIMGFFYNSASYIRNGGNGLVEAFQKALTAAGVDVLTNRKVEKIILENGRTFKGVKTSDGEVFAAASGICTVHPKNLLEMLPADSVRPVFRNKIETYRNTFSPFVVFAGTEKPDRRFANRNFYKFDSDKHFLGVTGKYNLCRNAISIIEPCDNLLTEKFMTFPPEKYKDLKNRRTDELISRFLKIFPEMKSNLQLLEVSTPRSFYRYTGSANGSMYGLQKSISKTNISPVTDIKGFYLAGQSIKIPGFLGAVESAIAAVSNLIEPQQLWKKIVSGLS